MSAPETFDGQRRILDGEAERTESDRDIAGRRNSHTSGATNMKTRILIIDDHPIIRQGLVQVIRQHSDLEVCGQTDGVVEGLQMIKSMSPDLVILDIALKDGHGLDLIRDVQAAGINVRLLIMSMHEEATYAERALRAGAHGYLPKSEGIEQVIEAVRSVMRGEVYLVPRMMKRLLKNMVGGGTSPVATPEESLSDRELQVFELLGQGLGSREIAERLFLSIKTIDTYREHLKRKLGAANGNELTLQAILWAHGRRP